MDLFLRAIECQRNIENGKPPHVSSKKNQPSPLTFEERPPQWCIVDKWFTVKIRCCDPHITQLFAVVYNMDGTVVSDALYSDTTKGGRAMALTNAASQLAIFKMKFISGSKGSWLFIGIHAPNRPDCLLKSPPIKVQTNRSKRPRDSRKKPVPVVTSVRPATVPCTGNFPGRKDRMLLIFGANFYLWGSSPVVRLQFGKGGSIEIKPPNVIWWSDHLLECQLPECHSDLEISVANYDLIFGDSKVVKVDPPLSDADTLASLVSLTSARIEKPILPQEPCLAISHLSINYMPPKCPLSPNQQVPLTLVLDLEPSEKVWILTKQGKELVPFSDIGAQMQFWDKENNKYVWTEDITGFSPTGNSFIYQTNLKMNLIWDLKTTVFLLVKLKRLSTDDFLLDPLTHQFIEAARLASVTEETKRPFSDQSQGNCSSTPSSPPSPLSSPSSPPNVEVSTHNKEVPTDIQSMKQSILTLLEKINDADTAQKLGETLRECMNHVDSRREELKKKIRSVRGDKRMKKDSECERQGSIPEKEIFEEENLCEGEDQTITIAQPQPHLPPGIKSLVYWKFFNPGNRTFLELNAGKLQIIGSRRIQMFIEALPRGSKFINAHLYIQKNDKYEIIENCTRCKENGIPNVFCVLPRRGREHDYPWITFRITCTSTAKHWKGSPFWIGAEYLLDPTSSTTSKLFSPPIHVQSKVKSKDFSSSSPSPPISSEREA